MRYYSFLYILVQINFTEKESQLQKIFLKSAIGFFIQLKALGVEVPESMNYKLEKF